MINKYCSRPRILGVQGRIIIHMLQIFWNEVFFKPVFNTLIFIYNNFSHFSFGIAVIYLTVFIRVLLLPLSITSSKSKEFYHNLSEKVKEIDRDYGSDYIKKREAVRNFLRRNKVSPWMKTVVLSVQLLVLILLYQVFVGGLNAKDKINFIYPFIEHPDYINPRFLWFDLGKRDWAMSSLAGIFLFIEIIIAQSNRKEVLAKRDQLFKILFPLFTIVALGILPSVKSVFILTSILFSIILILVINTAEGFSSKKKSKKESRPAVNLNDITLKRIK